MKNLLIYGVLLMLIGGIATLLPAITHSQAQQITQQPPYTQPQQPQMQQQIPQQQSPLQQQPPPQPQLQQGQPLYNPNQVIACLNHALVDSMVKAGTTGSLTLHNNTKGAAPGLNQTFIQNATNTLDLCIIPMRK